MPAARRIEDVLVETMLLASAAPATISDLAAASRRRVLQRDEVLFIAGTRATTVCVVATGTLRVFATSAAGNESTLAVIHAGELVGELGVLDDVPRSASIGAIRRSDVIEIPAHAFRSAYDNDPAIARRLVTLLSNRMRAVNDGFADLTYLDLGGRVAKYLLGESMRQKGSTITLALTQADLGRLLGGARQSVNQVLQALERSGMVELDGHRKVRIVDEEALRDRASSGSGKVF